jgi:hypothetical protein
LWVATSQAVEQQSAFAVQFSPPALQATDAAAAHAPPSQTPEQHSVAAEQRLPPARHRSAGSTQRLAAHAFVQQSALEPHTAPVALHRAGSTQVPVHAPEQHSEGSVHDAVSSLQDAAALAVGSGPDGDGDPPWRAAPQPLVTDRRATASTARTARVDGRMLACSASRTAGTTPHIHE